MPVVKIFFMFHISIFWSGQGDQHRYVEMKTCSKAFEACSQKAQIASLPLPLDHVLPGFYPAVYPKFLGAEPLGSALLFVVVGSLGSFNCRSLYRTEHIKNQKIPLFNCMPIFWTKEDLTGNNKGYSNLYQLMMRK